MMIVFSINKLKKIFIYSLIVAYIFLALIYQQQLFNGVIKSPIFHMTLGLLIIAFNAINSKYKDPFSYVSVVTFLSITLLIFIIINSLFIRNQLMAGAIFVIFVSVAIAHQTNFIQKTSYFLLFPFWFLAIYILMRLIHNPDPNHVFLNSRNYISYYLILTVVPYYFIELKYFRKPKIIPIILTLLFSVYSLGRSGIIASFVIFVAVLWPTIVYSKKNTIIFFIVVLAMFFSFLIFLPSFVHNAAELERFANLSNFISEGGRSNIIASYFHEISISSFIFGVDPLDNREYLRFGHFHSSLLNFFSGTGAGCIIFLILVIWKLTYFFKVNFSLCLLFLGVILRISTDVGALFGYFDYVIWLFLLAKVLPKNLNVLKNPNKEIRNILY